MNVDDWGTEARNGGNVKALTAAGLCGRNPTGNTKIWGEGWSDSGGAELHMMLQRALEECRWCGQQR